MIQINPLQRYIDGGARAAITTPPSASLVFDLPGRAIWVKGVKLKGTDHTYTFSHDNYISLTNTPGSNESEDIKIGINTTLLKQAIDTTYGIVNATTNGLAPMFSSANKATAAAATTYNFLGIAGTTLKWYSLPWRNVRINTETTDKLGVNDTDPLIISQGTGISVTWDSSGKKIVITNTAPDQNHNTDSNVAQTRTVQNKNYPLILKGSADDTGIIAGVNFNESITYNPSTQRLLINSQKVVTVADVYVGATASAAATSGLVPAATSAQRTYFLRGDGTWATPQDYNTWRPIKVNSSEKLGSGTNTGAVDFVAGTGITLGWDATNKKITITNSAPDQNHNTDRTGIKLGAVSGNKKTDSTVILANSTVGLTIAGGTNKFSIGDGTNYIEVPITINHGLSTKNITINGAAYAIYTSASSLPTFVAPGSYAGTGGYILATNSAKNGLEWVAKPTSNVTTSAVIASSAAGTSQITAAQANPFYNLLEGGVVSRSILFVSGTGITISAAADGKITITNSAPDVNHNTHYTTSMYIGENNDTKANKVVTSPYLKLFDDNTRRSTLRFISGTGISVASDANGNITITNNSPDVNHNVTTSAVVAASATGTAQITAAQTNPYYNLLEGGAVTRSIRFVAGNGITISAATDGLITITNSKPDVNHDTHYTTTMYIGESNDTKSNVVATNPYLKLFDNNTRRSTLRFVAGNGITIGSDASGNITITNSKPDVNHDTHYTTTMFAGENNDTKANKVATNPYLKLFDNNTRRSTLRFVAGTGITIASDANGNITVTNSAPDVNHNTDRTGVKLGTVSGTKIEDSTLIIANSGTGLVFQGGTNLFKIGDGTNYIQVPITPSFTVTDKAATIGRSLTTIATINGTDITAKIADYVAYYHNATTNPNIDAFTDWAYLLTVADTGSYGSGTKASGSHNGFGVLNLHTHSGNYYTQLGLDTNLNRLWIRSANNVSSFGAWSMIADAGNISNKDATIGTSSTTIATIAGVDITAKIASYAASNHTHSLSIAADSGTSSIALAASTKYKLTAGGSTYIFTSTPDENVKQTNNDNDQNSPILLKNGTGTGNITSGTIFADGVTVNPKTNSLTISGTIYGSSGNGLLVLSNSTGSWKEGIRVYPASNNYSLISLLDSDSKNVFAMVTNVSSHLHYFDVSENGVNRQIIMPYKAGTIALLSDLPTKASWDYDDVYVKKTGDTMTGSLSFNTTTTNHIEFTSSTYYTGGTTEHMSIGYGRILSWGQIRINADTDESKGEYVLLTSGRGVSDSTVDGLAIGYNTLTWLGNTVWHAGNDGASSGLDADLLDGQHGSYYAAASSLGNYLPLAGGTMTGTPYIYMPASPASIPDSQPFGITYGKVQCYGTMYLASDTDGSQSEYTIITSGYGMANATKANGLAVGYNTLTWKNNTIWHAGNDGSGSGLDADLLDGNHASDFALAGHNHDGRYARTHWSFASGSDNANVTCTSLDTWVSRLSAVGGISNYGSISSGAWWWVRSTDLQVNNWNIRTSGAMMIYSGDGSFSSGNYKHFLVLDAYADLYGITSNEASWKYYARFLSSRNYTDYVNPRAVSKSMWGGTYIDASGNFQSFAGNFNMSTGDLINMTGANWDGFAFNYNSGKGTTQSTRFYNGNAGEIVRFTGGGNVGIGTSSPGYKLDVNGNIHGSHFYMGGYLHMSFGGSWLSTIDNDGNGPIFGYALALNNRRVYLTGSPVYITGGSYSNYASGITVNSSNNVGIGTTSPSYKLHVSGGYVRIDSNSRYLLLGAQNTSHAHYETNADVSHWFNKRVDVNGAIWRYNTNYGIASDGYFYAKGVYANRDGSSTLGGVSLYSNTDPMTYGIAFRGISSYGSHGWVSGDWATYFTMSDDANRGWIFKKSSGTVASISNAGHMRLSGSFWNEGHVARGSEHIISPKGGSYSSNNYSETGYIIIRFPIALKYCMMSLWIDIFSYSTDQSCTIHCGAYTYDNSFGHAPFSRSMGRFLKTRFCYDSSYYYIVVGESNSTWYYPKFMVRDMLVGYSQPVGSWINLELYCYISTSKPGTEYLSKNGGIAVTDDNGSVTIPGHYYESSDIRLKHDISMLSKSIRKFKFNNDDRPYYGFIAQELETLHPELVDNSGEYKTVNYNSAICYYIAELENKVQKLEDEINKLKNK